MSTRVRMSERAVGEGGGLNDVNLNKLTHPSNNGKQILIDGQVYIDGVGAMSSFPKPVASLGIQVRCA